MRIEIRTKDMKLAGILVLSYGDLSFLQAWNEVASRARPAAWL